MKKEKSLKPKLTFKRRLIQLYAALLTNANIKGFATGSIFLGNTKSACVPGLNCYSCPGAVGACPLGSLQNALASTKKTVPYYMLGIILLYCIMLGRWICGFLCPFGLIQDLLHKIKTPKLKKSRVTRILSYFKYVLLVFFVVIIPLAYMLKDMPLPAFCKYICPAGTLGGAISLLLHPNNAPMFEMLGPLFTWKFALMISILVGCVFIYRLFCRFICPLGALYGLFNKISVLGIKLEKKKCIDCGLCVAKCKVDIKEVGDHECISCGECISVCPTKAISWKGSKIILPENEIPEKATAEEKEAITKKREKRVFTLRIIAAVLMIAVLATSLVYFNFIYKAPEANTDIGTGEFNVEDYRGKVVVINFWGTWCSGCKKELPAFDRIASEFEDKNVVVVTVHTSGTEGWEEPDIYIDKNLKGSKMLFVRDVKVEGAAFDTYYKALGGNGNYPMTLVLDDKGVINYHTTAEMTYDELLAEVEAALAKDTSGINPDELFEGYYIGDLCPSMDLEFIDLID
ncbi:MAG: 4Fe-4S binding protein [Clostridia bacterium]|nr:4Fe-4S binding protein [Clostridia bacterium]